MSVTSTRRVSGNYSSTTSAPYAPAQGRRSFVENIDTTNNVLISDEADSSGYKQFAKSQKEENKESFDEEQTPENFINSSQSSAPLLDNDEDTASVVSNKNIGIYGTNQEMSSQYNEKLDNPYIKHLYEKNEVIEDVDEFV